MKRILAVILALAMLLTCAAALAETTYPLAEGETFKLIIRMRPLHSDANEMEVCTSSGNRFRRQSTMK